MPATLRLGEYLVGVALSDTVPPEERVPVLVIRDPAIRLVLKSVDPTTGFPGDNGTYNLILLGEGFSEVPEDNVLVFDGRDEIEAVWTGKSDQIGIRNQDSPVRGIFSGTHKLVFQGIPAKYWGAEKVELRVGDTYSDPPLPVNLSGFSSKGPLRVAGDHRIAGGAGALGGLTGTPFRPGL